MREYEYGYEYTLSDADTSRRIMIFELRPQLQADQRQTGYPECTPAVYANSEPGTGTSPERMNRKSRESRCLACGYHQEDVKHFLMEAPRTTTKSGYLQALQDETSGLE